ncbi:MAG: hypothetical protein EOP47_15750 [Sphingobacteriaceae bacterium]|nr:MAG: hypothetical protein EOP47_15750 [Sphingobacteriaceae bacterium]
MKRELCAVFLAICCSAKAQQPSDIYNKALKDVLTDVEKTFHVKVIYKGKLQDTTVKYATWRFTPEVSHTLDNILYPLGLGYRELGKDTYLVTSYEYYRRSDAEGKKHLAELLTAYPDAVAFDKRKAALRKSMLMTLGINRFDKRTPLNPIIRKKIKMEGYTVRNVAFESIPGYFVCGTLYMPIKAVKPYPVILSPNGHFYGKGESLTAEGSGRYGKDEQYLCAALAKMGAIVFNYDMYSWGESALLSGSPAFHETNFALAIQTWNSTRALDFLLSIPNADKSRIGVTGASGGGTQTFLLGALDGRVTATAPVVMVSSSYYGGCPCESGLPIHEGCDGHKTNNTEIAALIAPKRQLIISDGSDWTQSVPGTDYPYLKKVYDFYGKEADVENVHLPNDGHDYGFSKRVPVYHFFANTFGLNISKLYNEAGQISESGCTIQKAAAMHVFSDRHTLPANALKGHEAIKMAFGTYQQ